MSAQMIEFLRDVSDMIWWGMVIVGAGAVALIVCASVQLIRMNLHDAAEKANRRKPFWITDDWQHGLIGFDTLVEAMAAALASSAARHAKMIATKDPWMDSIIYVWSRRTEKSLYVYRRGELVRDYSDNLLLEERVAA